ncbi:hypothetical protein BV22DRAFT_1049788 [Leucogyrophana mollusca]|uniref:Uncharacterized protein n=1 Tax=Leucogyrophana mollusca TaxID=85980 RepID=A0ACB8B8G3_9AGAM|nr:hypothetical protein BV22DRAFT_1049788 [Leucogyrophana mollusca]
MPFSGSNVLVCLEPKPAGGAPQVTATGNMLQQSDLILWHWRDAQLWTKAPRVPSIKKHSSCYLRIGCHLIRLQCMLRMRLVTKLHINSEPTDAAGVCNLSQFHGCGAVPESLDYLLPWTLSLYVTTLLFGLQYKGQSCGGEAAGWVSSSSSDLTRRLSFRVERNFLWLRGFGQLNHGQGYVKLSCHLEAGGDGIFGGPIVARKLPPSSAHGTHFNEMWQYRGLGMALLPVAYS